MPTAIAAAIATATAIGTFLGFVGTVATIVGAVVVIGTVALATKAMKRKQMAGQSSISGTLISKSGSSASVPVIYGERRVAGHRTFVASNGAKNANLHIVETLCEGQIEGVTEIYFNDELAGTSSDNGATWDFASYSYSGVVTAEVYDGSQTTASSSLVGEGVGWVSTSVGNGVAYVYLKLVWDEDKFGSGLPNVTYKVKGKKVPAIGAAWDSTLTYSTNPIRILQDYFLNPVYGKGVPNTLIDAASFNAAVSYCDEQVNASSSDATQVTRYTTNAYLDTTVDVLTNFETLLTACRAGLITGDKYRMLVDRPTTPLTVKVNDDNIVGDITFLQANKKTLLNSIRTTFPNKAGDFNYQEDISIVDSATLQGAAYDGVKLQADMELEHTTDADGVERISTEEINQSRQSGIVEVTVDPSMIDLTVGDVIKFSNATLGQTDKLYRIISTIVRSDHTIVLNMREYDSNVYWDNNTSVIVNNKDDTDH